MFAQRIRKHIQQKSIQDSNITEKHVADVLSKFCSIGIAKTSSLKQHAKQIEYIDTLLECFEDMQTFELEESQQMLKFIQNGLSEQIKVKPLGKEKVELNMSAAMNTIVQHLEKGRENTDTQKFYAGIEAATDYLKERKAMLLDFIDKSTTPDNESELTHDAPGRFFSPDSTNPPPTKRRRVGEYQQKTENKKENTHNADTGQNQESIAEIRAN